MGTGVRRIDFSDGQPPVIQEYATPVSHYEKRKRGPEVAAPTKVLKTTNTQGEPSLHVSPEDPCAQLFSEAQSDTLNPSPAAGGSEPDKSATHSWNKGFMAGGFLRTVPENSQK